MTIPDTECHTCQHYKGVGWDPCSGERGDGCSVVICAIENEDSDNLEENEDYECPYWQQRTPERQAELDRIESDEYLGEMMSYLTCGMIEPENATGCLEELKSSLDGYTYRKFLEEYEEFLDEYYRVGGE